MRKEFVFYYVLLIFMVNMRGLFIWKIKKALELEILFNILDESNCNPNKTCVDKGSEFYNRSMISCLQDSNIKTYSTCNEGKLVAAEGFLRTVKTLKTLKTYNL